MLASQIIRKDRNIAQGFGAATRFLFESRLGLKLMERLASRCPVPAQKPRHPATAR